MKYLLLLILVFLGFTLPFKDKLYSFDWDQNNDYLAVEKIAQGKFTLIGPRVTSDTGFFLGPWHYYFLYPFYKLTNGSLDMGFWAAWLVQLVLVITSFYLAKKWFGIWAGIATGLLMASVGSLSEWGFMYVPIISLLFFVMCLKTLDRPKLLPWLLLFFGFGCTVYTVFYALGIPLLYVIVYLIFKKKTNLINLLFGLLLLTLPYIPIFIFDLRHNFLNLRNMLGFVGGQSGAGTQPGYFIVVFIRALGGYWLNTQLPNGYLEIGAIIALLVLIFGAFKLFEKQKVFVLLWLVSSLIPMAFFKGNVSEYYYAPVVLLIPFFLSGLLVKRGKIGKVVLGIVVVALVGTRMVINIKNNSGLSLKEKIDLVENLDGLNSKYSVSYDLVWGQDGGYRTIFNKMGKNYVDDGSSQLYTITYKDSTKTSGTKVFSTDKLAVYKR